MSEKGDLQSRDDGKKKMEDPGLLRSLMQIIIWELYPCVRLVRFVFTCQRSTRGRLRHEHWLPSDTLSLQLDLGFCSTWHFKSKQAIFKRPAKSQIIYELVVDDKQRLPWSTSSASFLAQTSGIQYDPEIEQNMISLTI